MPAAFARGMYIMFAMETVLFVSLAIWVTPVLWLFFFFVVVPIGVLIGLCFLSAHLWIDTDGVHARMGRIGWPNVDIPLNEIESAEVSDIRPMSWGGWGYRGNLKMFKRAAIIMRSGPGVRLQLTEGRVFVMTVDHPEQAVEALHHVRTG